VSVKFYIKTISTTILSLFIMFLYVETSSEITFAIAQSRHQHNIKIIQLPSSKNAYSIADLTYQKNSNPYYSDMVLSFNYPPDKLFRDDTKKYIIKSSSYVFTKGKGSIGNGSAHFFRAGDGIEIENSKNLWLGSCEDMGSFAIEMRIRPDMVSDGSVLFSRLGYISGSKKGIEITINRGRITAAFYGIFERPDGKKHDIFLNRGKQIYKDKWYHFSVSFDRMSGRLAKFIDGEEDESIYVTDTGSPDNGIFTPYFGYTSDDKNIVCTDLPPVYIGKKFSGFIDEFRISYLSFEELKKRTAIANKKYRPVDNAGIIPLNTEGVVTSPVYNFPGTGTLVKLFKWDEIIPENAFVWMEFRISDNLFYWTDTDLKWYRIKNNQRGIFLKENSGEFLRGKYYQWRLHLVPSPDGKKSPAVYDINMSYQLDVAPKIPDFVEITKASNEEILIRWKKNVDPDIKGYRIYYGTKPGIHDGIITHTGGRLISNELSNSNYIEIKITNDLIDENRKLDRKGLFTYPLLKNTILYFFAVSAYDSYKPGTPHNHESALSKQVSARPYAGSEIN
jgi:hypothetical protein